MTVLAVVSGLLIGVVVWLFFIRPWQRRQFEKEKRR